MKIPQQESLHLFPKNLEGSPWAYYTPFIRNFYLFKLEKLLNLLPKRNAGCVLEVGYGCGIALKELADRCEKVHAIDIHPHQESVMEMLRFEDLKNVALSAHDIFKDPWEQDNIFDFVISSSVFEHIDPDRLEIGIRNIALSLRDNGYLLVGFPHKSCLTNFLFSILSGTYLKSQTQLYQFSHDKDHPSGQKEIIPVLQRYFVIEEHRQLFNSVLYLYDVLLCKKI